MGLASGASCNRLVVLGEADKAGRGQVSAVTLNGQNVTSGDNQHWPSHVCNKKEVKEANAEKRKTKIKKHVKKRAQKKGNKKK